MEQTFTYLGRGELQIFTRYWPTTDTARATVQVAHGLGEHSARYARFAAALNAAGYDVYAADHRGHGKTARDADDLGRFGPDGWNALVDDMATLGARIDGDSGGLPRVLFGHSLGSFALQQLLLDRSSTLAAAVLCGTSAVDIVASAIDPEQPTDLTFFNAAFEPARTPFDWLSRDDAEVDKYIADPLCGFGTDAASGRDMAANGPRGAEPGELARIRSDIPLLLIAGSKDPLNAELALVELVAQRYRDAGLTDVSTHWYDGARHELLNETNRDEVTADVVAWLATAVPS